MTPALNNLCALRNDDEIVSRENNFEERDVEGNNLLWICRKCLDSKNAMQTVGLQIQEQKKHVSGKELDGALTNNDRDEGN